MSLPLVEADAAHTGAMIALIPSEADAERLAVNGGEDPAELHVTLAYLGDAADIPAEARQDIIDSVSAAVNGMPVVEAELFGVAAFNPGGDKACLVYNVGGDLVDAAHTLVAEAVWSASPKQHAPFCAHLTAAYIGDLSRLAELAERLGPVRFDRLRIAFGGQALDIPLIEDDFDGAEDPDEALALAEADGDRNALKRYWLGKGLRRWATKKHPWSTLYRLLKRHLSAERAKRVTSRWFHDHFGYYSGSQQHRARESAPLAEAEQSRDEEQLQWEAASAALLATWPTAAAPLVDELSGLGAGAATVAVGLFGGLVVSRETAEAVTAGLAGPMRELAAQAGAAAVADAAAQGATAEPAQPDDDRLTEAAALVAAAIIASYGAAAAHAALSATTEGATVAVRAALDEVSRGERGAVAAHLRSALTAAQHEGRRAVWEASPALEYVSDERLDGDGCAACETVANTRYATLAEALADYPRFGYRACAGGARCRGRLRAVYRQTVAESYRDDQRRADDGRWTDGNIPTRPSGDRLNLGGRIRLTPGETLRSSSAVPGVDSNILLARIDGPAGPTVRLGVGILDEDRAHWAAADRGSTVILDRDGADQMASAADIMEHVADGARQRRDELDRDREDLEVQRRRILGRQYPNLSRTAQRRVDRIDTRIEDIDARVASRERGLADSVAQLPDAARTEWDRLEQQVADMRADGYTAGIPELRNRQAALHQQREDPDNRVGFDILVANRLRDLDRLRDERAGLEAERRQIAGDPRPLSDDDRRALARVDADLARVGDQLDPLVNGEPVYSGTVSGGWGDVRYDVALDSDGEPEYTLRVVRPGGGVSEVESTLDRAALRRLRVALVSSMGLTEAAPAAVPGPVELVLVEAGSFHLA